MNKVSIGEYNTLVNKYNEVYKENKRLKMIIKEYERLDNGESRGCAITRVDEYDIYDLIKCKDNWNKLKELIDIKLYNTEYLQKLCGYKIDDEIHMVLDIIKKKMKELEAKK